MKRTAGKWFADKAQAICCQKKKDKLVKVYPYYLWNEIHIYSALSVVGSEESTSGVSVATSAAGTASAFLALPPRRLFAFTSSFLPNL